MSAALAFAYPGCLDQPTGGYRYDRYLIDALTEAGWAVTRVSLPASLPDPSAWDALMTAVQLATLPAGQPVIVDGLALGAVPDAAKAGASRGPLIALVHHPLAAETGLAPGRAQALHASEAEALGWAHAVVTPSHFTAQRLTADYAVPSGHITVAPPGLAVAAQPEPGAAVADPDASVRLLCVGSLTPRKGQDVLLAALGAVPAGLAWHLDLVGAADHDPAFARGLRDQAARLGIAEHVTFAGAVDSAALARYYARAHVLVVPSRYEGYGMVVHEGLAAGVPVIATDGGALAETVPAAGCRQVPAADGAALAEALTPLLRDPAARAQMRQEIKGGAPSPGWADTAAQVSTAVTAARERAGLGASDRAVSGG